MSISWLLCHMLWLQHNVTICDTFLPISLSCILPLFSKLSPMDWNSWMPSILLLWKQQNIVKSSIRRTVQVVLLLCKKAKLQAGIKPTALCSVIDKENLIEFPLDFLHYLYNYYMVCVLLSHAYHVTHHVTSCDVMLWLPVIWLWHLWHDTFLHSLLCSKSKIKGKEKKNKNKNK